MALSLGIYCEHINTSGVEPFTQWLGRTPDSYLVFTGHANWQDYVGSVPWLAGVWKDIKTPILWSVPLIATGANLTEAGNGAYDNYWLQAAKAILASQSHLPSIVIRPGWEFNGNWYPWAAGGKEALYAAAFRRFVTTFRTVSDKFLFEWCPNISNLESSVPAKVDLCYPGDAYVDFIGMDNYYFKQWHGADPVAAFMTKRKAKYGLDWLVSFSKLHTKPITIPEWGVDHDNAAIYLTIFAKWMVDNNVVRQCYWDSNGGGFTGKLTQYPTVSKAYKQAFIQPVEAPILLDGRPFIMSIRPA